MPLLEDLRSLRLRLANAKGRKPFHIFPNTVLNSLCQSCPTNLETLLRVPGIGPQKLQEFGADIVQVCRQHGSIQACSRRPLDAARMSPQLSPTSQARRSHVGHCLTASMSDPVLREALRRWRSNVAQEKGQPAFCVFNDATLDEICRTCPRDLAELKIVRGFGHTKVSQFGSQILDIVKSQSQCRGLKRPGDFPTEATPPKRRLAEHVVQQEAAAPKQTESSFLEESLEKIDEAQLTPEQRAWAAAGLRGENLFITGEAGTGKSFLLKYLVQELRKTKRVAVTATTGLVAASLGGTTVHAFAGVGLGRGVHEQVLQRTLACAKTVDRWRSTDVLAIDEISMLDSAFLTLLEELARLARGDARPFGGLQVVGCGDFLQLPPVEKRGGFAFQSEAWRRAAFKTAALQTPQRQNSDPLLLALLSEVRRGFLSSAAAKALADCDVAVKAPPTDGIEPTRLYCMNQDVDAENLAFLSALPGEEVEVHARDDWKYGSGPAHGSQAHQRVMEWMERKAPAVLRLKVGAQVLLTKNISSQRLANGSRGVITSWVRREQDWLCPVVLLDDGRRLVLEPQGWIQGSGSDGRLRRLQLPLKLGWALTVHRAQGTTLSRAELQLAGAFEYGQVYVALSRVRCLSGLWLRGARLTGREVRAHPEAVAFYGFSLRH